MAALSVGGVAWEDSAMAVQSRRISPVPPDDVLDFVHGAADRDRPSRYGDDLFLLREVAPRPVEGAHRDTLDLSGIAAADWAAVSDGAPTNGADAAEALFIRIDEAAKPRS